ncbi:MAG: phosphate ABC transporter substrate-binding protein [candidate division WOR-3 bacterium]
MIKKFWRGSLLLWSLIVILTLLACSKNQRDSIILAGSTSIQPFAERLTEVYSQKHKNFKFNVQGGGSSAGIKAVKNGVCHIGMSSRELKKEEKGLYEIVIAYDGIVIIVNQNNPLTNLTLNQVADIFAGKIKYWSELGETKSLKKNRFGRINVITREEGSGTRQSFEEIVMRKERIANDALVQDSNGAVREIVANDPNAIGYISYGLVDKRVKALSLDSVIPSVETIRQRKYPIVRSFLFLTKCPPRGKLKEFIDFVLSAEGQKLLQEEGLIPIR